jgi:hypothetical protein
MHTEIEVDHNWCPLSMVDMYIDMHHWEDYCICLFDMDSTSNREILFHNENLIERNSSQVDRHGGNRDYVPVYSPEQRHCQNGKLPMDMHVPPFVHGNERHGS